MFADPEHREQKHSNSLENTDISRCRRHTARKAERSNSLNDLREYQNNYPGGELQFREKVLEKIATLEWKEVESIQKDPQPIKIQKYLAHFPDATRLP